MTEFTVWLESQSTGAMFLLTLSLGIGWSLGGRLGDYAGQALARAIKRLAKRGA